MSYYVLLCLTMSYYVLLDSCSLTQIYQQSVTINHNIVAKTHTTEMLIKETLSNKSGKTENIRTCTMVIGNAK